ncbi:hypothetical protein Snov_0994 [Ancylobacter novellus DSM 506]|uniref:Uncharacterized protein n=1 Tax=Ancylobacter novellus (strain ATCC 8093 / DSM 506 / JCM 20403 / CCM 1077 / IAM 12100 / NBRC 12443 / NCIMB 10456) TaxID=639283 RepID=D7A6U2_ANCN5|nr:hypothetical protein [Ancylobacter novellus]ADH88316.1 hypothetical protein Snov_0994 [Ancylobacter novellus DSM 506]
MIYGYARALLAGLVALAVNFSLLGLADRVGIVTARGGFQRLVKLWAAPLLQRLGVDRAWAALHLPDPGGALFTNGFKVVVGLVMAVIYLRIKPLLPGSWLEKGLAYALLVWLINAGVVLPALGQGFAGIRTLSAAGILAFAIAHTAFFLVLAALV